MSKLVRYTLALSTLLTLGAGSTFAAGAASVQDRTPCDPPRDEGSAATSAEERLAGWLVERILDAETCADPVVDYDAEEVEEATGVSLEDVDLDEVRNRVQAELRKNERWGEVRVRPPDDRHGASHESTNAGAHNSGAGSGSAAGRGATAASPGGSPRLGP
jgi:hypothetical protein